MQNQETQQPLKSPALDENNDTVAIPRPANELEGTPADSDEDANDKK